MSSSTLKLIAIITMLIDHTGAILFPDEMIFRIIGRLAFPIFAFFIVEGYFYTHSVYKYMGRLLIFALVSEIPFDIAFHGAVFSLEGQNIFFTLLLGLITIHCIEKLSPMYKSWSFLIILSSCAIALICKVDYYFFGIIYICAFYYYRGKSMRKIIAIGIISFFMGLVQGAATVGGLLTNYYNGKRGVNLKYLFYWFYPVHILVLYGISMLR